MRGERGQASVEWIGALLATALALGALARLADRVEATSLATTVLATTTCAARGDCEREGAVRDRRSPGRVPSRAVTAPPLVPLVPAPAAPRGSIGGMRVSETARRRVGVLWRRAWLACFGYERVRYGLLHPESRPRQTVPVSGTLQMVNDCLSPFDFARDWELLRPR
jgi:hypothetical protein